MDFWRAYRVVAARKWLIAAVVIIASTIVGVGILLFGRKWDGQTMIGPTDQAVRRSANALNDEKNMPILTDDTRKDEAKRIADEIKAPNNAARAIYFLRGAGTLRAGLIDALAGKEIGGAGSLPVYDTIKESVDSAKSQMDEDQITRLEQASQIPSSLWGDFVYLDSKLAFFNINKEFLSDRNVNDSVRDLAKNTEVEILNSRDITVAVRNREPRLAEILANALTASYKEQYDKQNHGSAKKTVDFYAEQLPAASRRFAAAQAALYRFRRTNKDVFTQDQVSLAIRDANTAQQQLNETQTNLEALDAQIAAKRARLASLPRMLKHPVQADSAEITSLRSRISDLNASIAEKSATWTDKNPEMVRLKDQLKALQTRLKKVEGSLVTSTTYTENDEYLSLEREIARLGQNRRGVAATVGTLNGILAAKTRLVGTLPEVNTQSQMLSSEFNAAGERLQDVSRKLSSAREELAKTDAAGALQVAYWAGPPPGTPEHPESPAFEGAAKRNWVMFIAAILLSLVGSVAIVLGLDYLDTSVKTTMDVERMLDVPVNGVVPRLEGASRAMLPQVTHRLPASAQAESYRFLGTDILLSANGDEPFKTIMVATAKPGQGGTSTICNLAITLAQAGQTVVLVDADMRRPSLHTVFNVPNEQGLTTVLSNGKLPSDVLQRTEVENLYVMTGGPHAENAWKLLRSHRMKEVISDLQRDFDFVLFDTPSAIVFADAATLASMVDGVLLVVRAHEAPSGSEMQVKNLLNKTKARIVGVVLNDMPVQQVDSARYFSHYYAATPRHEVAAAAATAAKPALPKRGSDDEI